MPDNNSSNRKSYSAFYKTYRRMRYLYYLKRLKKRKLREERDETSRKEEADELEWKRTLKQQATDVDVKLKIRENISKVKEEEFADDEIFKGTKEKSKELRTTLLEIARQREMTELEKENRKALHSKKTSHRKTRSKSSFNIFYRTYRIFRYTTYLKKLDKQRQLERRKKELLEQQEFVNSLIEQDRYVTGVKEKILENKEKVAPDGHYKVFRIEEEVNEELIKTLKEVEERGKIEEEERRIEQKILRRKFLLNLPKYWLQQLKNAILSINKENIINTIKSLREEKNKEMIKITINSTSCFLLAYLVMYFIYQLTSAIATTFFNFDVIMYFDKNTYLLEPDEWTYDSVKTIYSSGPLITLLVALVSTITYFQLRETSMKIKLFFLWLSFHGYTMFFGGLLIGTLFSKGFGHVLIWSYVMDTGKLVVSLISISILIAIGLYLTKSILVSANSYYKFINATNRRRFILGQILYPYLIGNLVMFFFWIPEFNLYFQLILVSLLFLLSPALLRNDMFNDLFFDEGGDKVSFNYRIIIAAAIIIVLYRIIFEFGIRIT